MAVWNVFIQNSCFGAVMKISLEPDCGKLEHKFSGAAWLYSLTLHKRKYFSLAALQLIWEMLYIWGFTALLKQRIKMLFFSLIKQQICLWLLMMIFCPWLGCVCRCEGETSVLEVFFRAALNSVKGDLVTVNISREISKVKKKIYF